MALFTIRKTYFTPSFDIEVKERLKIDKFLVLLENSGVREIIPKYMKNQTDNCC